MPDCWVAQSTVRPRDTRKERLHSPLKRQPRQRRVLVEQRIHYFNLDQCSTFSGK
ncbi:MAG: hypothetical protein LDL41_21560 [Coleofasciculus sp. S288]|nr:hypothetical protein [Coleofasciculus sp. S288]